MIKGFLFFLVLLAFSLKIIGNEYNIRYQYLSGGTLFYVESVSGVRIGKIQREKKPECVLYSLFQENQSLKAQGFTVKQEGETKAFISDSEGNSLGSFVAKIAHLYPHEYKIFDKNETLIGHGYLNWVGSAFDLIDPQNPQTVIASFSRPMFKLVYDYWHIKVKEDLLPVELLWIIGVFQTACDLNFERF